jgi:hypothetical protein
MRAELILLVAAAAVAVRTIDNKQIKARPALGRILVEAADGRVAFAASSLDLETTVNSLAVVDGPDCAAVLASVLKKLLAGITSTNIGDGFVDDTFLPIQTACRPKAEAGAA